MKFYFNSPQAKEKRRQLRKQIPEPENILWYYLRNRRFLGVKFRRQYSVGRYVLDFYCPTARLGIELDGDSHFTNEAREYDQIREEFIQACGIRTLRFTNAEIIKNIEGVLEKIRQVISPPPFS